MENQDISWKKRFEDYFKTFEESIKNYPNPSDLEKTGLIRCFGFVHQFALDATKDLLLTEDTVQILTPRSITELAIQKNLIENKEEWFNMMESKRLALEIYNEADLENQYQKIKNIYYPLIEKFYLKTRST